MTGSMDVAAPVINWTNCSALPRAARFPWLDRDAVCDAGEARVDVYQRDARLVVQRQERPFRDVRGDRRFAGEHVGQRAGQAVRPLGRS
jgi:hypothetical protein